MIVFRIGLTKYAQDLSGEGARLHGGRWNHPLIPCVYTSASRALAILEYTVNVNVQDLPPKLSITSISIPQLLPFIVKETSLPKNWREVPAPSSTRDYGSNLLRLGTHPLIQVPSTLIPEEFNYLINPTVIGAMNIQIVAIHEFEFDVRIKHQ